MEEALAQDVIDIKPFHIHDFKNRGKIYGQIKNLHYKAPNAVNVKNFTKSKGRDSLKKLLPNSQIFKTKKTVSI